MRIYFSAVKKNEKLDLLVELGARSFLFSYEDKKVINQIKHLAQYTDQKFMILVDSGAFSAWNRGAVIHIDEYIKFIDQVKKIETVHEIYFINLDIIPHKKGEGKPTLELIEKACIKGIENYHYIKSHGHSTIHTFHQFENFKYLDLIIAECNDLNYIGVSPANDQSVESRNEWLGDIFLHIRQKTRTHVLGLTAMDSLEKFPAFSADSSSWLNSARFGELFNDKDITKPGRTKDIERTNIFYHDPKIEYHNSFYYYLRLERYITKLWEKRGIKW